MLILYDLGARIQGAQIDAPLAFSLFGDIVGGAPTGALVAYVSFSLLGCQRWTRPSARRISYGLTALGTVASVAIGGYLFFVYQLPDHVTLDVRKWDTVSFDYVALRLPYSYRTPELATGFPISVKGWLSGPIARDAVIEVRSGPDGKGQASEQMSLIVAEPVRDFDDGVATAAEVLDGANVRFSGIVQGGEIKVESEAFNLTVIREGEKRGQNIDGLVLIHGGGVHDTRQRIQVTKDPRAIMLSTLDVLGVLLYSQMNRDVVGTSGGLLSVFPGPDAR